MCRIRRRMGRAFGSYDDPGPRAGLGRSTASHDDWAVLGLLADGTLGGFVAKGVAMFADAS